MKKQWLRPIVQDWLNDAGLRTVGYSILMNFGKMLERVLFVYRGLEPGQEQEREVRTLTGVWVKRGLSHSV